MSFILWFSAVLVGLSALGATFIVARSARRRWKQNRLEGQAERVRALLEGARKDRYDELDKLLFELRANYDPEAIGTQLQRVLETNVERGEEIEPIVRAFRQLGLATQYRELVRNGAGWRDRARAARVLGLIRDAGSVEALLAAMRDPREDRDVKLAAAEALSGLDDPSVIPVLCDELARVEEWSSPRLAALLVSFGEAAVGPLLKTLDAAASLNARIWAAQILGKIGHRRATQPLIDRLHDRSQQMRMSAANALGDLGDLRAVRPLVDIVLRDPASVVRVEAAAALGKIGDPDAVPVLVSSLGDPEYWMRFRALEAIEVLAPEDTTPIEAALDDGNAEVRLRAALALERLGKLDASFDALGAEDDREAEAARTRLVAVGRAGLSERFIRHLGDPSPRVRSNICRVLGAVGEPGHAGELTALLKDADADVRLAAIDALGQLGKPGTGQRLIELFDGDDVEQRTRAADALRRYPPDELTALEAALEAKLASESDGTRLCAVRVLAIMPGEQVDAALIGALHDRFVEIRLEAVRALGQRRVAAAVDPIGDSLADPNSHLRVAAAEALGAIGGERALDLLLAQVRHADRWQRDAICRGIASVGYAALGPALDVLLGTYDVNARVSAAWTLGKTGDQAAVPLLAALLADSAPEVRSSSAGALGKIRCEPALAALRGATRDPSRFVRAAVVNALGRIGGGAELDTLAGSLGDPDAFVRNRAAVSIGQIGTERGYGLLVHAPERAVDNAALTIALGLTGVPDAIGAAVSMLRSEATRRTVLQALEREPGRLRSRFLANVRVDDRDGVAIESLDPSAIAARIIATLKNSQEAIARRRAIAALAQLDAAEAAEALAGALRHDPDVEVRLRAASALAARPATRDGNAAVLDAVLDPAPTVRVEAIQAAGRFATRDDALLLLECLRADEPEVVEAAEHALAQVYRDHVLHLLDWMMGQTQTSLIASALRITEKIADSRSLGLLRYLVRGASLDIRLEAARALAALHDAEAVKLLLDTLADPVERVRAAVVAALSTSSRNDVVDRFDLLRLDPSVAVRSALASSLHRMRNTRALDVLDKLAADQHPDVRALALGSLLQTRDTEGQHRFLALWDRVEPATRRRVQNATAHVADTLQHQLTTSPEPGERQLAVRVLAALGAAVYGERIALGLADPDPEVRLSAIEALSSLDPARVSDWLARVIDDPVADVRAAARRLLMKLVD